MTTYTIRRLRAQEITADAELGHDLCVRQGCDGHRAYATTHTDDNGRTRRQRLCVSHGSRFAQQHELDLPVLPQRPKDHTSPLPSSVVGRGTVTEAVGNAGGYRLRRSRR